MTFWGGSGSGSADPCLQLMIQIRIRILDPDPAIIVNNLEDASKKIMSHNFFDLLVFEGTFTSFFKHKMLKIVKK
jgi:hypothetical protein